MKKILKSSVIAAAILGCGATGALATPAVLYDWAFNIDGAVTTEEVDNHNLGGMPVTAVLDSDGLGTFTATISGAGSHNFLAFFDYEFYEGDNTWSNESGSTKNDLAAGQSWEIGDPWVDSDGIFQHFISGSLENTNSLVTDEEDVSMAMAWNFDLLAGEIATIFLTVSYEEPLSGFYLTHSDPGLDTIPASTIYLSGRLTVSNGNPEVPEPTTMLLMGTGLAGLLGAARRRKKQPK